MLGFSKRRRKRNYEILDFVFKRKMRKLEKKDREEFN